MRDLFTEDFTELVVSGNGAANDAYEAINAYVTHVAPHLGERLTQWDVEAQGDPFGKYRIDDQIAKAGSFSVAGTVAPNRATLAST